MSFLVLVIFVFSFFGVSVLLEASQFADFLLLSQLICGSSLDTKHLYIQYLQCNISKEFTIAWQKAF